MTPLTGKKIICAVTNDLTYDRRMFRICTALASAGAEVVLTGRRHNHSVPFTPDTFRGVRLRCVFKKGFLFYAEYNIRLMWYLLTHHYDIACACDLDTALPVRLVSWLKGKKTVYDAHEYFSEVPELNGRPRVKRIWERIGKWTVPGFTARYTVGEELAKIMAEVYGAPFDIIRNIAPAASASAIQIPVEQRERILLYQGAINVGRGLEACMRALKRLPAWTWWIAGEGDITAELKQLAQTTGVGDRVVFLGWVHPDEIPGLQQKARLAINLREPDSLNDFYSLPNKFFDAINAGLPSVNMQFPEYTAVVNRYPCSILISQPDEDEIVRVVEDLDQHPEKLTAMSQACIEAAKVYTWENESQRLIRIYQSL